ALATAPPHHVADAQARAAARLGDHRVGVFSALRRAVRHDARRSGAEYGERALFHVRRGIHVVEPRSRLGDRVPPGRAHPRRDMAAAALGPSWRSAVNGSRAQTIAVHALLVVLALFALFPLAWMLSVSFMAPGEASTLPPPLLPKSATLANYH